MSRFNAGDDTSTSFQQWRLSFRNVSWMQLAIAEALSELANSYSWNPSPTVTSETAADYGTEVNVSFLPASNIIGTVLPFAGIAANVPPGALLCDGASYLRADYPDLFAAIGTTWGAADGTHFNVPDLRGVTVIGVGTGSGLTPRALASFTGEESHTLSSGEMPVHSHSEVTATPFIADITTPTAPVAQVGVGITGTAGGGGAHNNMQPSIALNYVIVAAIP